MVLNLVSNVNNKLTVYLDDLPGISSAPANVSLNFEVPSTLSVTWDRPEGANVGIVLSY